MPPPHPRHPQRPPRPRTAPRLAPRYGSLGVSLLVHGLLLLLAAGLVVSRYLQTPEEPTFSAAPRVMLAAQIREHRLSAARHDSAAPAPAYRGRLTASAPSPLTVPAAPAVPVLTHTSNFSTSAVSGTSLSGLSGRGGHGTGSGAAWSGGGGKSGHGKGVSFFNIKDEAHSIVIMLDVSQSMFTRTGDYDGRTRKALRTGHAQAFQAIRDEAITLIDSLGPDTKFGIIRWSGSARSWKPELVSATDQHKAEARDHIQADVDANSAPPTGGRPGGTRHDYALESLIQLAPETAFMLTDGNATRSLPGGGVETIPPDELIHYLDARTRDTTTLPRIHTIYYLTGADKKSEEDLLRDIARKTKGKFRKIKAALPAADPPKK